MAVEAPRRETESVARRTSLRLAFWYAVAATLWIVFSDEIVVALRLPHAVETFVGSVKGVGFVLITAVLLYALSVRNQRTIVAYQERYHRLFENATEGMVLYRVLRDRDGEPIDLLVDDVNSAQLTLAGLTRETVIGQRTAALLKVTPDEMQIYIDRVKQAIFSGERSRFEFHFEETDTYLLSDVYEVERDLWVTAGTDITDLRIAQRTLREQQNSIRQAYVDVLDAVTGGKLVLLTDAELDRTLGRPLGPERPIDSTEDLPRARHAIAEDVGKVAPELARSCELLNPTGEALNNVLKHAERGTFRVYEKDGMIQVRISDHGPGIDFRTLPRATLMSGFSTTATLGVGFTLMLQLADRVLLATHPGRTSVVIEVSAARGDECRLSTSAANSNA